jgi:UDP-N-acetylmuramoyl-tripeptide--D-alanyl-D-alanine ligase
MATPIPLNDARFTLADILAVTGGHTAEAPLDASLEVRGVSTDTRTLRRGELYVAIAGERFDGHEHLADAASSGAIVALCERDAQAPPGLSVVRVSDSLAALGALARLHLERWRERGGNVIAITGSAGKTTTRQAVAALLGEIVGDNQVHAAPGNLNNLVGVPMTLLGLGDRHRHAVLELGTNRRGEIGALARMVRPDVGVLTLIAAAHAEGLGDIDAIAAEKGALFSEVQHVALGNVDDARVRAALSKSERWIGYGESTDADYRIVERRVVDERSARLSIERPSGGMLDAEIALVGRAGALACAAAVAAVEAVLGEPVSSQAVARSMRGLEGRLAVRRAATGPLILDDSYNANPASCASSIEAAREIASALGRRLTLVLGEMRELGPESALAHDELGAVAAASGAAWLLGVEGDARRTAERAASQGMNVRFAEDAEHAASVAVGWVEPDDVVLVKGSRGVRTELVVNALLANGEVAR